MIQDIMPHHFDNQYIPQKPKEESFVLLYDEGKTLIRKENENISFVTIKEAKEVLKVTELQWTYLFSIDQMCFYLLSEEQEKILCRRLLERKQCQAEHMTFFRTAKPQHMAFAAVTGDQIHRWYRSRVFCGRCGKKMIHDEKERLMRCPDCGQMEYPKICPAVIVGVTDHDRIVLTKYAGRAYKKYALIAGFAETGETIEDTVRREVKEEVGLHVKNIRFYKSQPWSFSDTLLMGFFCELDGSDKIKMDEEELAVAQWCNREEVPVQEEDISLTSEMMCIFRQGREKQ